MDQISFNVAPSKIDEWEMELKMDCPKWQGFNPYTIVSCRLEWNLKDYLHSVIAVCKDCEYACVWDKDAWVARVAKDFTKRKTTIGKLKDSLRDSKTIQTVFLEDL
jgi:hypothetical protein